MNPEKRMANRVPRTGAALVRRGSGGRALTGVVTDVSSTGAGLRVPDPIPTHEAVTVTMAFEDRVRVPTQEKLSGIVAWMAPASKGFLLGIQWDRPTV